MFKKLVSSFLILYVFFLLLFQNMQMYVLTFMSDLTFFFCISRLYGLLLHCNYFNVLTKRMVG